MSDYLFPHRLTRRDFLAWAGAAGVAAGLGGGAPAAGKPAVKFGSGKYTYTLDENWGRLPEGMQYGFGCAVVVDGNDRVYVTSRSSNPCVAIFDKGGKLLETWSKDLAEKVGYQSADQVAATAHGLYWSKEGNDEFLYWTENVAGPKTNRLGARVYKTDLKGRVLYTLGNVDKESSTAQKFNFTNPTDVAVAANGDIYVVDGYGSQLLHRFDKNFKLLQTIGGPGKEHGKFNVCHGVWISTLRKEPEVYVADRGNHRVEVYSPDLKYLRTITDFRLPCCFYQYQELLYVPELGGRVAILAPDDTIVGRLGTGDEFKVSEIDQHPDKFSAPHALTVASNGDLYVIEWILIGRPRRFRHTPASA